MKKYIKKLYTRIFHDDLLYSNYWGQIYNSTIANSNWLEDKAISPGRWAVGYGFLYVLYRCLNDVKPQKCLELGLGQSTKVIGQYTRACGQEHIVVEHDSAWKEFFLTGWNKLSSKSKILILPLQNIKKGNDTYYSYSGFKNEFCNKKFDFVSVDGPFGGDVYSRRDILDCLPDILEEKFIILFDDCGRVGEKQTVKDAEVILRKHNIPYEKGLYSEGGDKIVTILVSKEWGFLCSL